MLLERKVVVLPKLPRARYNVETAQHKKVATHQLPRAADVGNALQQRVIVRDGLPPLRQIASAVQRVECESIGSTGNAHILTPASFSSRYGSLMI